MNRAASAVGVEINGLSDADAAARLERDGPNEMPRAERRRMLRLTADLMREPMTFLLLACGGIYMVVGDRQEALMLLAFLGIILAITLYQERKAERALAALRELSSPRAIVVRNGQKVRIAGRDVVRGDVMIVTEGDKVAADGNVVQAVNALADESLLTGESVPVPKIAGEAQAFAGTTIVKGTVVISVTATGVATQLGKIGGLLKTEVAAPTRLEQETRVLVKVIATIAAVLCLLVMATYYLYGHPVTDGVLAGLTLAMAILPNELPAVLTIFMALGAWRLSKRQVLTRRISAIEALGSTTVLCVDKTGTLTYNRMTMRLLVAGGRTYDLLGQVNQPLPEEFHEVVEYGLLATEAEASDPMDHAFTAAGQRFLTATEHVHPDWTLVKQYPLTPGLLALSQAWRPIGVRQMWPVAAKGAPEAIVDLCHMPPDAGSAVMQNAESLAAQGLRVLGVAKGLAKGDLLPDQQHDVTFEFVGLVGFEDPVRSDVPGAIAECRKAGLRTVMITGDHPETAKSVARQIGLPRPDSVLSGAELNALTDAALARRLRDVDVCARIVPEQKSRLIQAFQVNGEVVAMTGDGVNDAPALRRADIGIAMGKRGTDVAREAGAIVLLEDDFASMVAAIRMGRRIYGNLQHAISYLLAVHIPIAGLSVIPILFNMPLILMPAHIAFLHLIIEPASSIAFEAEPENPGIMSRPPRARDERLYSRAMLIPTMVQGMSVLTILLLVFLGAWRLGNGERDARALAFTTLVVANVGLIVGSLARRGVRTKGQRNHALGWVVAGSISLLGAVLYMPSLRDLFRFSRLHGVDVLLCLTAGVSSSLWFWLIHGRRRR